MSLADRFAALLDRAQKSVSYWRDIAIVDFSRELHAKIKREGLSHADIAERMQTSRPYVTKLLAGGGNFTLDTMVKLAMAVNSVVRIRLEDQVEASKEDEVLGTIVDLAVHRAMRATATPTPEGAGTTFGTLGR